MENIERKLKNLKSIKPDNDYSLRSLSLISSSPKISSADSTSGLWRKIFTGFQLSSGVILVSAFVLIIFMSAIYLNTVISPLFLPGLNDKNISVEAHNINESININLNEIKYRLSEKISKSSASTSSTSTSSQTELRDLNKTLKETLETANDRLDKIQKDVKKLENLGVDQINKLNSLLDASKKELDETNQLFEKTQTILDEYFPAEIATSTENAIDLLQFQALLEEGFVKIKSVYETFLEMSVIVKNL